MMKANNQLGFININEDSIDEIIKDGEAIFERGFLREKTSTTLPTTFDGVGKDLKDYKIYGNTYQNSTSGKNKYGIISVEPRSYGNGLPTGVSTSMTIDSYDLNNIKFHSEARGNYIIALLSTQQLEPNTDYILSYTRKNTLSSGADAGRYLYAVDENDTYSILKNLLSGDEGNKTVQFTTGSTGKIALAFGYLNNYVANESEVNNIMIRLASDTDTTFEPYTGGQPSPNPDYLQEIVSCGDKTKNLLGFGATNNGKGTQTTYDKKTGLMTTIGTTTQGYPWVNEFDVDIPSGTSLTISSNSQYQIYARLYYDNSNYEQINSTTGQTRILTHDIIKIALLINIPANTTINETYYVQIEENSIATSYEPYGYKIPVNVRSENIFDKDNANVLSAYFGISDNKDVITSASTNRMIYIPCKPNTTYIILKSLSNQFSIGYTYVQPTIGVQVYGIVEGTINDGTKSWTRQDDINAIVHLSITTNENAKYLVLRYTNINNDTNSTWQEKLNVIQIVEGSTAPSKYISYYNETTNIYLDEPLRKIDGYSDYIDFVNQKVVRNISEVVLNGSETWRQSSVKNCVHNINLTDMKNVTTNNAIYIMGISNKFLNGVSYNNLTGSAYQNFYNRMSATSDKYLSFSYETTTTINDWKTWLQSNNVTVDYVLATPTEDDIELPNIPTIDGNNILNIETEITPSQVYIKYKSNT